MCKELGLTFPKTKLITSVEQLENSEISDYIVKPVYSRFGHNVQFNPSEKSFRGKIDDKKSVDYSRKNRGKITLLARDMLQGTSSFSFFLQ